MSSNGRYAYTGLADPPSVVKVDLSLGKVIGRAGVPDPRFSFI